MHKCTKEQLNHWFLAISAGSQIFSPYSHLPHTEPADQVDQSRGDAGPEHCVAGEVIPHQDGGVPLYGLLSVGLTRQGSLSTYYSWLAKSYLYLSGEDDSNDKTVDGDSLTEDDRDQVLSFDPWSLDAAAHNGGPGGVDPQGGPHNREADGEADTDAGPHIGRGLAEEPTEVDPLPSPSEDVVESDDCEDEPQEGDDVAVHILGVARGGVDGLGRHHLD